MKQRKAPSFQFYPSDWLTDTALRACSIEARGFFIDLICLMHQGSPYGTLSLPNGKKLDPKTIKKILNFDQKESKKFPKLIQELVENGVIKESKNGLFYSSRMVEDERVRKARAESGKLGGNPNLVNHLVNQNPGTKTTPSSSSSSSSSTSSSKETPIPPKGDCEQFEKFWSKYPSKKAKKTARNAWRRKKLDSKLDEILAGVERQLTTDQWKRGIVPNPSTFINQERWLDEDRNTSETYDWRNDPVFRGCI